MKTRTKKHEGGFKGPTLQGMLATVKDTGQIGILVWGEQAHRFRVECPLELKITTKRGGRWRINRCRPLAHGTWMKRQICWQPKIFVREGPLTIEEARAILGKELTP